MFFVSQVGACETSPNQLLLAWTEDTVGGEKYTLHVKVRCRLPLLCFQCHCTMGSVKSSKTYMCCRGGGRQYYCGEAEGWGRGWEVSTTERVRGVNRPHVCYWLELLAGCIRHCCWHGPDNGV